MPMPSLPLGLARGCLRIRTPAPVTTTQMSIGAIRTARRSSHASSSLRKSIAASRSFWTDMARPAAFCTSVGVGGFVVSSVVNNNRTFQEHAAEWRRRMTARQYQTRGRYDFFTEIKLWWQSLSNADRVLGGLVTSYLVVYVINACWCRFAVQTEKLIWYNPISLRRFAGWRLPIVRLHEFVFRNFVHMPFSGRLFPMIGCHFSHHSPLHLLFNSMALWSFGSHIAGEFGTEQFLAFSLGAAMSSTLFAQCHSVLTNSPRGGLGASGVIMGLIAAFACSNPEATVFIPFLPFLSAPVLPALGILMSVDVVGVLLGWKVLGHAAHLGGSCFGLWYTFYGQDFLWWDMKAVLKPLQF